MKESTLRLALLYAGIPESEAGTCLESMRALASVMETRIRPACVWRVYETRVQPDHILLEPGRIVLPGGSARIMLERSEKTVLMLATLSSGFDFELARMQKQDMADALLLDALGSAWIEEVLDQMQEEIQARFPDLYLSDRFSCGYGDLPLELQPRLVQEAQAGRRIGVQVSDSLLMNPMKSVSALAGLSRHPVPARVRGCAFCSLKSTCAIHKKGNRCESI